MEPTRKATLGSLCTEAGSLEGLLELLGLHATCLRRSGQGQDAGFGALCVLEKAPEEMPHASSGSHSSKFINPSKSLSPNLASCIAAGLGYGKAEFLAGTSLSGQCPALQPCGGVTRRR